MGIVRVTLTSMHVDEEGAMGTNIVGFDFVSMEDYNKFIAAASELAGIVWSYDSRPHLLMSQERAAEIAAELRERVRQERKGKNGV